VSSFTNCALSFRFSAIDRLPEPPSPHLTKGTLVHRALEGLFWHHPPGQRTLDAALDELTTAWDSLQDDPDLVDLHLSKDDAAAFLADAEALVRNALAVEDPNTIDAVGVELTLEASLGDIRLRGIIDRLDRTAQGGLIVTDYKTGRVPAPRQQQSRFAGVHFYALLCELVLGERPVAVQLLYLRQPVAITSEPSTQTLRALEGRTKAVWSAIDRACHTEDFRPKPSPLCSWCSFQQYCPTFGGNPADALVAHPVTLRKPADSLER
jgi:putative RecB family exonuclease